MVSDAPRPEIDPGPEQLARYLADDDGRPVTMLNLLRFRPGGRELYGEFVRRIRPLIESIGGEIVYAGEMSTAFVPAGGSGWDAVVLSRWPRRDMLLTLVEAPEYPELRALRAQALEATIFETTVQFVD